MKKWIGFYDRNGKKIYEGDLVLAHRARKQHTTSKDLSGKFPKRIPVLFKVEWSKTRPEYTFSEVGPLEQYKKFDERYHYRYYPYFECKPKWLFHKKEDGSMANEWHYDLIKHVKGEKKYKCLWEVELYRK